MISRLRGILDTIGPHYFIIDVQGVGYQLFASAQTLRNLPRVGEEFKVFVHTQVRQDSLELFGFSDEAALDMFVVLLTVPGVGTRVALAIQSALKSEEIFAAIQNQDKTILTRADGVGPKLAARLVLELKEKIRTVDLGGHVLPMHAAAPAVSEDAVAVLLRLGYRRAEAVNAVQAAMKEGAHAVEEIVKLALAHVSQGLTA